MSGSGALVDSSAIIDFLLGNKRAKETVFKFDYFYVSTLTVFEVLLGRVKEREVLDALSAFRPVSVKKGDAVLASRLAKALMDRGTMIDNVDVIIAAQAINRGLTLVTKDRDFLKVKEVARELELELIT